MDKAGSKFTERLKGGDVVDQERQRLMVKEREAKLDGLARKDLLSSFCFLQEESFDWFTFPRE